MMTPRRSGRKTLGIGLGQLGESLLTSMDSFPSSSGEGEVGWWLQAYLTDRVEGPREPGSMWLLVPGAKGTD